MTVAIVHDYFNDLGGAERVACEIAKLYPEAPLYAAVYDPKSMHGLLDSRRPTVSFLDRFAKRKGVTKALFPLLPAAIQSLQVEACDVVLSSSSGFAHHVRVPKGAAHVCYCYTPPRFLWASEQYFHDRTLVRASLSPVLELMRRRDFAAAQRVDAYIAISTLVAKRIESTYRRQAVVIHPPIDLTRFRPASERSGRFLVISRLLRYKRLELAIQASALADVPLDIVGDGPARGELERMAGHNVRFLGRVSDAEAAWHMARCAAVVIPGPEDFGLAAIEALACGRPPIVNSSCGARDVVEHGRTGFVFDELSVPALATQLRNATNHHTSTPLLLDTARLFGSRNFHERIESVLRNVQERVAASNDRGSGGHPRDNRAQPRRA